MIGLCNLHSCTTYGGLCSEGRFALERAGLANAALDARVLLEFATGWKWQRLFDEEDEIAAPGEIVTFSEAIDQRIARVPVAQIVGRKEFWSLEFKVTRATLIPRPESEHVVEAALALFPKDSTARVLDLGTGTGCLIVSLLSERPNMTGVAADISAGALDVAKHNAKTHKVADRIAFAISNWASAIEGTFDLVIANPPYLTDGELAAAEPEMRDHEPRAALAGGLDGLDAYRAIARAAPALLRPAGALILEIGSSQNDAVRDLLTRAGLEGLEAKRDLAGLTRVVTARKPCRGKMLIGTKNKLESAP